MAAKYSEDHDFQHHLRFSDIAGEPRRMLLPIQGYERKPLVSLEEAVEPLVQFVPDVKRMAYVAKMKCDSPPADNLSTDESAAIILYSMEWEPQEECLYFVLNATLREENRRKLVPWFLYLKLVLTALSRLPSEQRTVYRGVKCDMRQQYKEGETIIWWGFSSCTTTMSVLKNDQFLGSSGTRTFFTIECKSGKNIQQHSQYKTEDEVLLLPARQFKVVSCLNQSGGLYMIQLREIDPPFPLLEPVSKDPPKPPKIVPPPPTQKEHKEFKTPGTYEKLYCEGRPCTKCGKCRDWYYTDAKSWKWVQNCKNWTSKEWKQYRDDKYYDYFKRRDGATCLRDDRLLYRYRYYLYDHCLCDDNCRNDH